MFSLVFGLIGVWSQPRIEPDFGFDPYDQVIRAFDTRVDTNAELLVRRSFLDTGEAWVYKMQTADKTDQILIEFVTPSGMKGIKALFDQKKFRQSTPGNNAIAEGESPFLFEPSNKTREELVRANYTATYDGKDVIAGRGAYKILLKPKSSGLYERRIWVDKYALFLLRHDVWEKGGSPTTVFRVLTYRKRGSDALAIPAEDGMWVTGKEMPKVVTDPGVASTLTGFALPRVDDPPYGLKELVRQVLPTKTPLRPLRIRLTDGVAQINVWIWKARGRGSSTALEVFGQDMKLMATNDDGIGVAAEGDFPEDARVKIAQTYLKSVRTLERSFSGDTLKGARWAGPTVASP